MTMMMKSVAKIKMVATFELLSIPDDVGMIEFLHDTDLLVDVFLQERLLLQVSLTYDFYGVQLILF